MVISILMRITEAEKNFKTVEFLDHPIFFNLSLGSRRDRKILKKAPCYCSGGCSR